MKKVILITFTIAALFSCKKEKGAEPQPTPSQTWNGLYCISFYNESSIPGQYDTIGKQCGNDSLISYYSDHANPYHSTYTSGKRIYNCNECH